MVSDVVVLTAVVGPGVVVESNINAGVVYVSRRVVDVTSVVVGSAVVVGADAVAAVVKFSV